MSDTPLFEETDEQEATYASPESEAEIESTDEQDVDLPVVGLAPSGMATPTTPAGPPGVVPPGVAPLPDDEDDSERPARD